MLARAGWNDGAPARVRGLTGITLDRDQHLIIYRGKSCTPQRYEMAVCVYLAANPGFVRSRPQIMDAIYPDNLDVSERAIDSIVKRIRALFGAEFGINPIGTLRGVGYRWVD